MKCLILKAVVLVSDQYGTTRDDIIGVFVDDEIGRKEIESAIDYYKQNNNDGAKFVTALSAINVRTPKDT